MRLGDEIRGHLPFLRRYARALTGSQQHGDNFVHTLLEVVVAAPEEFSSPHGSRIDLYRAFHRIWESAFIEDGEGDDEDPFLRAADRRLARITPLGRQILLLTALEGFSTEERSEEHTSELQSLMRISYAVFCLKKKTYEIRQKKI